MLLLIVLRRGPALPRARWRDAARPARLRTFVAQARPRDLISPELA